MIDIDCKHRTNVYCMRFRVKIRVVDIVLIVVIALMTDEAAPLHEIQYDKTIDAICK